MSAEDRFVVVARRFASLVEGFEAHSREEFVRQLEPILLELSRAALELGHGDPDDDDPEVDPMGNDDWWKLYKRLEQHLGDFDAYSVVFDPYDLGSQPVTGQVSDDVADIYRDLLEGLNLYDAGHRGEAVWQWRFGFDSHWGRHTAELLYALRVLRADRGL